MAQNIESHLVSGYDPSDYPPFAVTADIALFTILDEQLCVLLIERGEAPFKGRWALPGGFVGEREDVTECARRELFEETGIEVESLFELGVYSAPDRDPRMRVVSVAHTAFIPHHLLNEPAPGSDANVAGWIPVNEIMNDDMAGLAFDHDKILLRAIERLKTELVNTSTVIQFLPRRFTLSDLRRVYEIVWGRVLHPANFRRKVLGTPGFVVDTGEVGEPVLGSHHARLYQGGSGLVVLSPPMNVESMVVS